LLKDHGVFQLSTTAVLPARIGQRAQRDEANEPRFALG
jgi:hypothetical protein